MNALIAGEVDYFEDPQSDLYEISWKQQRR
ncbi:MAG: hypothetical protein CM1200mP39_25010 [Dehalococcoidia bacterium]|nr:MAG: hypothetical protein CM1200mP39_25010 [Dehalococcoidia bacterium]